VTIGDLTERRAGARYDQCMQDDSRTRPLRIDADRAAGTIRLEWADGHQTSYDAATLRWLCPCAYCRGEAGLPGWLDSNPVLTPDQTRLVVPLVRAPAGAVPVRRLRG
jgi:hypothetical protein